MSANRLASGLALAAVLAGSLLAQPASAWSPIDNSQPVWQLPVGYRVNQDTIPGSIAAFAVQRIDEGFAEWGSPGCSAFEAVNEGDTNLGADFNDGANVLMWISNNWPNQLGNVNQVIGVTLPVWDQNGMDDADIVFNDDGFCWNDSGNGGCVDTASIVTHEEGHFIGLGHSNDNNATMAPGYPGGGAMASIEQDDEDGVCTLYPSGGQQSSSANPGSCDSCQEDVVDGACAGVYNACGQSQACVDFYNCVLGCQSDACVQQCQQQNPNGAALYIDFVNCICDQCATECAMECGGSSSSSSSSTAEAASAAASTGAGETVAASVGVGGGGVGPSGNAGVGGTTGSGDDGGNDADTNLELDNDSGCGCRTVGGGGSSLPLLGLAAGAAALMLARRRRRG